MRTEHSSAGKVPCGGTCPPSSSPRFGICSRIPVVTSSVSRICRLLLSKVLVRVELRACIHMVDFVSLKDLAAPSLEGAHKDRVACVYLHGGVCVRL